MNFYLRLTDEIVLVIAGCIIPNQYLVVYIRHVGCTISIPAGLNWNWDDDVMIILFYIFYSRSSNQTIFLQDYIVS